MVLAGSVELRFEAGSVERAMRKVYGKSIKVSSPPLAPNSLHRLSRSLAFVASELVFLGAPPGFRTQNLRIKSPLLCR